MAVPPFMSETVQVTTYWPAVAKLRVKAGALGPTTAVAAAVLSEERQW